MGLAGGGPMGRSARLYRSLVAAGLARSARSDIGFSVDPYLLTIDVTALPGVAPEQIETVVDAELERIRTEPVGEDELARAVKQVAKASTSTPVRASPIRRSGSVRWSSSVMTAGQRASSREIEAVTPEDVQRAAQTYLTQEEPHGRLAAAHRIRRW